MALLQKELRARLFMFPCLIAVLLLLAFFCRSNPSLQLLYTEQIFLCIPTVLCCMLYSNNDECELVISSRLSNFRCFASKFAAIFLLSLCAILLFFAGRSLLIHTQLIVFALSILSCIITALFFLSLASLLRLLFKNAYLPIPFILILVVTFSLTHEAIRRHLRPEYFRYFDPYLSDLGMGDPVWICNRLLFLGVAILLSVCCYILLKKDRLHN